LKKGPSSPHALRHKGFGARHTPEAKASRGFSDSGSRRPCFSGIDFPGEKLPRYPPKYGLCVSVTSTQKKQAVRRLSGPSADYIIGDVLEDFFDRTMGENPKRLFGPYGMRTGLIVGVFDSTAAHYQVSDFTYLFCVNMF
jgi:hypothetical protein